MPAKSTKRAATKKVTPDAQDKLTAERVGAMMRDPATPQRVQSKLSDLVYKFYDLAAGFLPAHDPDITRVEFEAGAFAFRRLKRSDRARPDAEAARAAVVSYIEQHEAPDYKLGRRIYELMQQPGDGATEIIEWFDELLGVLDWIQIPEIGIPRFAYMAREARRAKPLKPAKWTRQNQSRQMTRRAYDILCEIVGKADAGESLDDIAAERRAAMSQRDAERDADALAKPEPKDKTSDAWRLWKLAQFRHAFTGEGHTSEQYGAAWREFEGLLKGLTDDGGFWYVNNALRLLPTSSSSGNNSTSRTPTKGARKPR